MTREVKPLIQLEQLEPRIMLSGDGLLNIAPNPQQDTILDNTSLTDQYAELLDTHEQVEEQISLELTQPETTNTDVCQPIFTLYIDDENINNESSDVDLSVGNIGPARQLKLSHFLACTLLNQLLIILMGRLSILTLMGRRTLHTRAL